MPTDQLAISFDQPTTHERDLRWLQTRLDQLLSVYFTDLPRGFPIDLRFGSRSQRRWGSIVARQGRCIITMNRLFAHPDVPDYVVDATLAHELAHYVHGYGSGLPKKYAHPHRGGVVNKELASRGLADVETRACAWRDACWMPFYERHASDLVQAKQIRKSSVEDRWQDFLSQPGRRCLPDLQREWSRLSGLLGYSQPPYEVDWLFATNRQTGMSYLYSRSRVLRFHAALADPKAPIECIQVEMAWWLAQAKVGRRWPAIEKELRHIGLGHALEKSQRWRRSAWTRFRRARP
jgi:hypothetical protein